jgi:hypothetical protein
LLHRFYGAGDERKEFAPAVSHGKRDNHLGHRNLASRPSEKRRFTAPLAIQNRKKDAFTQNGRARARRINIGEVELGGILIAAHTKHFSHSRVAIEYASLYIPVTTKSGVASITLLNRS